MATTVINQTVYVNQSALMIRLDTESDLKDATIMKIQYTKPDGERGSWNAAKDTERPTRIYYDIPDTTIIDQEGPWVFWSDVTFAGGRRAPGVPVDAFFAIEGI